MRPRCLAFLFLLSAAVLALPACGGDVEATSATSSGAGGSDPGSTTATSTVTSGSSTSTTGGGEGGSGGAGSSSSAGGAGGAGPSPQCLEMAAIVLSDPMVSPGWGPGETATVTITMTNPTAADVQYPGVGVSPDHPGVTPPVASNTFFVVFAGTSVPIDVGFMADASVPAGTAVGFQASLIDLEGTPCPNVAGLAFDATLE